MRKKIPFPFVKPIYDRLRTTNTTRGDTETQRHKTRIIDGYVYTDDIQRRKPRQGILPSEDDSSNSTSRSEKMEMWETIENRKEKRKR